MNKKLKITLIAVAIILTGIQFVHPAKNTGEAATPNDISNTVLVPADVQQVLTTACYDCHSNHTEYPAYFNIQPVAWWMQHHVNDGKKKLNFSEFKTYPLKRQLHKLEEVVETIEQNEMPLSSYTWTHKKAILTQAQKDLLIQWARDSRAALADTTLAML